MSVLFFRFVLVTLLIIFMVGVSFMHFFTCGGTVRWRDHIQIHQMLKQRQASYINGCKYSNLRVGQACNLSCVPGTVPHEPRSCSLKHNHEVRQPKTGFQITNKYFTTICIAANGQEIK